MAPKRKRYPIEKGAILPHADRATIDPRKLTHYALDPSKDAGKAAGFAALGIGIKDWRYVYDAVLAGLGTAEVTHVRIASAERIEYTVEIPIVGLNSRAGLVVTGWCVDSRLTPWLATLYSKPEPHPKAPE